MTYPYASTDSSVVNFIAAQNSGPGGRGSSIAFTGAIENNGIAGITTNNVIGFAAIGAGAAAIALGGGANAIILDGAHATIAAAGGADPIYFSVDTIGSVTLTDANNGDAVTVSGAAYLLFNGAATNSDGSYQSIFFIGDADHSEVVRLYTAAFGRQPDLAGVEYYGNQLAAGYGFLTIAGEFMASPEFRGRYGVTVSDTQFIANLYQNVLHRAPVASEVAYYQAALSNYEAGAIVDSVNPVQWSRAQELLNFTNSPECQQDDAGFLVNTAGSATNGLVYQDVVATGTQAPTAFLTQSEASGVFNTANVDVSGLTGTLALNGSSISPASLNSNHVASVYTTQSGATVDLSPIVNNFLGGNADGTVTANTPTTGGSNMTFYTSGTANLHGTGNIVEAVEFSNSTAAALLLVNGFVSGDQVDFGGINVGVYTILSGSASSPVKGSSLSFLGYSATGPTYFIYVGAVGGGSAAEVAAAANKAYVVSDQAFERVVFFGQTSAGGTAIFDWFNPGTSVGSADANANHQVDPSEFNGGVLLVGVPASAITTASFYHP